jgi:hypothetical protein
VIVISEIVLEKPVPVKVIISPPYTLPYLGEIEVSKGVRVEV